MMSGRAQFVFLFIGLIGASACLVGASGGCVRRTIRVTSDPPGALVYMNYQEVGRTPLERDFKWYGTYEVQVRREGYQTREAQTKVIAPWWQWPPIDLFAELLPLTDERRLHYTLEPASTQPADPSRILSRAEELEAQLESSRYHRANEAIAPSGR